MQTEAVEFGARIFDASLIELGAVVAKRLALRHGKQAFIKSVRSCCFGFDDSESNWHVFL